MRSRCNLRCLAKCPDTAAAEAVDGFRVDRLLVVLHYKYNTAYGYLGVGPVGHEYSPCVRLSSWCAGTLVHRDSDRAAGIAWVCRRQAHATQPIYSSFHAKTNPALQLPIPTLATAFEVVAAGRFYCVKGTALQKWILQKQQEWKGPKGLLFSQRPTL